MRIPACIAFFLLATPTIAAEPIVGRASVTDGDTVVIRDTRIRLHGIDAPESAQFCQDASGKDYRCGQAAALALSSRIGASPLSCEPRDTDRYGRTVAVCRLGGDDLNAWMVSRGHAVAYQRYSADYTETEAEAKAAKRGIWAGTFQEPTSYRRAKRSGGEDTTHKAIAAGGCAIKGNVSANGDMIYHMPGTRDYARTRINEKSGERMFCTKDQAIAAGWRRPAR